MTQSDKCDALISAMAVWIFSILEPVATDDFRGKALNDLRAALLDFRGHGEAGK